MGTWEHIKLRELPWHNNALRFFRMGEIPQNTHSNKKGVVYIIMSHQVLQKQANRNCGERSDYVKDFRV
jgi:hypothetical protein